MTTWAQYKMEIGLVMEIKPLRPGCGFSWLPDDLEGQEVDSPLLPGDAAYGQ